MKIFQILAVLWLTLLLVSCAPGAPLVEFPSPTPTEKAATATPPMPTLTPTPLRLTVEVLRNSIYPSTYSPQGKIKLTNGTYAEKPAIGQAITIVFNNPTVFGDLNGDGSSDAAVFLAANTGGTGVFLDLFAVLNDQGQPNPVASAFLGDRIKINMVAIYNGKILVDMNTQGPNDPMISPNLHVLRTYQLEGKALKLVSEEKVTDEPNPTRPAVPPVGIVWKWERFNDTAGLYNIIVNDPNQYTLLLLPDGTYQVKVDCNRSSGGYTLRGSSLKLEAGPITLVECAPGSLYQKYLQKLGFVVSYVLVDGKLYLNTLADGGDLVFSP